MVGDWVIVRDHNNHSGSGDNEIAQSPTSNFLTDSLPKFHIIISASTQPKAGSTKLVKGPILNKTSGKKVFLDIFRSEKYEYSVISTFDVLYARSIETKESLEYRQTTLRPEEVKKYSLQPVSGYPAEKKYNLHMISDAINKKFWGYRITINDENTNEEFYYH